jgi:hypothetical protein
MRTSHSVIFGVFVRQVPIFLAFCPNFLASNTPIRQLTEALVVAPSIGDVTSGVKSPLAAEIEIRHNRQSKKWV